MTTDWQAYYAATSGRPPRETLLLALESFDREEASRPSAGPGEGPRSPRPPQSPRFAIDLGCGAGHDARELLRRGWSVLAVDGEANAVGALAGSIPEDLAGRLTTAVARFHELDLPPADLVNASFSLPFISPGDFPKVWARIARALRPGGRFAGHFFGTRDEWAGDPSMTFHSADELRALLRGFEIEHWKEMDEVGPTATGGAKHWHLFSAVARKV